MTSVTPRHTVLRCGDWRAWAAAKQNGRRSPIPSSCYLAWAFIVLQTKVDGSRAPRSERLRTQHAAVHGDVMRPPPPPPKLSRIRLSTPYAGDPSPQGETCILSPDTLDRLCESSSASHQLPRGIGAISRESLPTRTQQAGRADSPLQRGRVQVSRQIIISGILAVLCVGAGSLYYHLASTLEETDDAQIDADIIKLSARAAGTVGAVHVRAHQVVKAGDLLVELDATDFELAVATAKANLARAEASLNVEQPAAAMLDTDDNSALFTTQAALRAVESAFAGAPRDTKRLRTQLTQARAQAWLAWQASGPRGLDSRRAAQQTAHASWELAKAQLEQARAQLSYTKTRAPRAGIVGTKLIGLGETVAQGQPLLAVCPVDELWVTANFRETQLRRMRLGQRVRVYVDALGQSFEGNVENIAGATDARFSLAPSDHSAGDFSKVVQRIPVKIALRPEQRGLSALRAGMSVEVSVRTR